MKKKMKVLNFIRMRNKWIVLFLCCMTVVFLAASVSVQASTYGNPFSSGKQDESLTTPGTASDNVKKEVGDGPNWFEKGLSFIIRDFTGGLSLLFEEMGATNIDDIILGRNASGVTVSNYQFGLEDGNLYGTLGAILYAILRNAMFLVFAIQLAFMLARYLMLETGSSKADFKSVVYQFVFLFVLLYAIPIVTELVLVVRDSLMGLILSATKLISGYSGLSLIYIFSDMAINDKTIMSAVLWGAAALGTTYLMANYAALAIRQFYLFGTFPVVAWRSFSDKQLLSKWSAWFFTGLFIPLLDSVGFVLCALCNSASTSSGNGEKASAFLSLMIFVSIIPCRNFVLQLFGAPAAQGKIGLGGLMLLARAAFNKSKNSSDSKDDNGNSNDKSHSKSSSDSKDGVWTIRNESTESSGGLSTKTTSSSQGGRDSDSLDFENDDTNSSTDGNTDKETSSEGGGFGIGNNELSEDGYGDAVVLNENDNAVEPENYTGESIDRMFADVEGEKGAEHIEGDLPNESKDESPITAGENFDGLEEGLSSAPESTENREGHEAAENVDSLDSLGDSSNAINDNGVTEDHIIQDNSSNGDVIISGDERVPSEGEPGSTVQTVRNDAVSPVIQSASNVLPSSDVQMHGGEQPVSMNGTPIPSGGNNIGTRDANKNYAVSANNGEKAIVPGETPSVQSPNMTVNAPNTGNAQIDKKALSDKISAIKQRVPDSYSNYMGGQQANNGIHDRETAQKALKAAQRNYVNVATIAGGVVGAGSMLISGDPSAVAGGAMVGAGIGNQVSEASVAAGTKAVKSAASVVSTAASKHNAKIEARNAKVQARVGAGQVLKSKSANASSHEKNVQHTKIKEQLKSGKDVEKAESEELKQRNYYRGNRSNKQGYRNNNDHKDNKNRNFNETEQHPKDSNREK